MTGENLTAVINHILEAHRLLTLEQTSAARLRPSAPINDLRLIHALCGDGNDPLIAEIKALASRYTEDKMEGEGGKGDKET